MTIREINELIDTDFSLKQISQAYGEIALIKIKKIRSDVEKNRQFFEEISNVYRLVKQQASLKKITLPKSKKSVSILLTSNFGFYGGIDNQVIQLFLQTTAKIPTDRIVIGRTGQNFLKTIRYFHQLIEVNFKADLPDQSELINLSNSIKDYSQILVFYPQLSTLFIQNPQVVDITQSSIPTSNLQPPNPSSNFQHPTSNYVIFEPELLKMIQFFDSQINTLLLSQTFYESELARTGSRILSMDQAQVEANKFIDQNKKLLAQTLRNIEGHRLLEKTYKLMQLKDES